MVSFYTRKKNYAVCSLMIAFVRNSLAFKAWMSKES